MEIIIRDTPEECADIAAQIVIDCIQSHERPVLGLPTGGTPERLYERLVAMHRVGDVSFANCTTFNLDEYVGLPPDHPQSYRYYMNHHLFSHIDIDSARAHVPCGLAEDLREECRRYETAIRDAGGIDLQVLGIGGNGHIGFNEPMCSLGSRTWVKILTRETIEANARYFDAPTEVPRHAVTMGVGSIMDARHCLVLATGAHKADAVATMVEGAVSSTCPASVLQLHERVTVVVDRDAGAKLRNQEHYAWVEENKLNWQRWTLSV